MKTLKLLPNVQFIYELAMAKLEMQALGTEFDVTNDFRQFELKSDNENYLLKRLAYFETINGLQTEYSKIIKRNQTRSVNQYLTHWIYPYKGKFHPQMIRALLNILNIKEGDTILDPFIGSGTTALEAQLMGINCIGIDISPLCVLQSKVKCESIYSLKNILNIKNDILNARPRNSMMTLADFDKKIRTLDEVIRNIEDPKTQNFYKIAELIAYSDKTRRKKEFYSSFSKAIDKMIASAKDFEDIKNELQLKLGNIDIREGDCRKLKFNDSSVDGIITSPPYSIALDYVANDAHAFGALGYDLNKIREGFVGVRGRGSDRIQLYNQDIEEAYGEMYRVLKDDKKCAIVIGNATYQGEEVKTMEMTEQYCKKIGFKLVKNIEKIIYGLYNVMQKENILIFEK